MTAFNEFCIAEGLIPPGSYIFTMKHLDREVDLWICGWIMKSFVTLLKSLFL